VIPPFEIIQTATDTSEVETGGVKNGETTPGVSAPGKPTASAPGEQLRDKPMVRRFAIHGSVPPESWADIFRSFVNPATRMPLKKMQLGIQFEMETNPDQPLDDQAFKTMRE